MSKPFYHRLYNSRRSKKLRGLYNLCFICIIALTSCGNSNNEFTLKGQFRHLQDGRFFLYSTDPSWEGFDTVQISDGKFTYSRMIEDTLILTIQYPNFIQMPVVAIPGGTVKLQGDANNLLQTKIKGNKENELLTEFRQSIAGKSDKQVKTLAENFIIEHPERYASLALFHIYFACAEQPDGEKTRKLLNLLTPYSSRRSALIHYRNILEPYIYVSKGERLPSFRAISLDGDTITEAFQKDKPALITFWNTWTKDMQELATRLKTITQPYRKKLSLLNISLDADTTATLRAIRHDSIPGIHICDRDSWQSEIVSKLGIRYFPSNILLSAEGEIIARDLDEGQLQTALQDLFQEP